MIRLLKKRPEDIKIFAGLCNHAVFYENYDENGLYAYTGFEIYSNKARVHMQVFRWSHNIAKKLKVDWNLHALILLELGVNSVTAVGEGAEGKHWYKFVRMFGFGKPIMEQKSKVCLFKE